MDQLRNATLTRAVQRFATVAVMLCATSSDAVAARQITVVTTIQAAVDEAQPGDIIIVPSGVYRENVQVAKDGLTIQGSAAAILDGDGLPGTTGIRVAPVAPATLVNGFTLHGLTIRNYRRTGVLVLRTQNYRLQHTIYENNLEYGPFPIFSRGGIIAFNRVSGSNDAGIYIGRSTDAIIRHNIVTDNTTGIQVENSERIEVVDNLATRNSLGLVVLVNPFASTPTTRDVHVSGNRFIDNNRDNAVVDQTNLLSRLPAGVGILNIATDRAVFSRNIVMQHESAGIVVVQLPRDLAAAAPSVDPRPDDVAVIGNVLRQNGGDPDPRLAPFPGVDLLWDGSGTGNCWSANVARSMFPELPPCASDDR